MTNDHTETATSERGPVVEPTEREWLEGLRREDKFPNEGRPVVLHRHPLGYRLDLHGESYLVIKATDAGAPSVAVWEVRREWDRALLVDFTTLADVRRWAADPFQRSTCPLCGAFPGGCVRGCTARAPWGQRA